MTKDQIFEFFRRLAEDNPEPETELEYGNAFQLVVAVALSAQATDVGVNKATRALFQEVKTPEQMLELGEDGLKDHIKTIGLFNSKAKNVIALSQLLVDEYGGEVPDTREDLVRLGQDAGTGRGQAGKARSAAIPPSCASLADPAWPLCLQGTYARMLALPVGRSVQLQEESD